MIRQLATILTILSFFSCDSEKAPSCLKTSGDVKTQPIEVPDFSSFEVNQEFVIYLEEASEQKITVSAGENLLPEITFEVIDNHLIISDGNSCDWVRDYNFPVVRIAHPNLTSIRQNGGGEIRSSGTLTYPDLTLISEKSTGDFILSLNCDKLAIVNNELSNYYLSGIVDNLRVGFYAGDSRFEGADLLTTNANVFQRGSNDIIVHATESLVGSISSTGDLIFVGTKPSTIDVSIENQGRLIDRTN